jgi:uncharacterized phiE125 gp8 family phage protein
MVLGGSSTAGFVATNEVLTGPAEAFTYTVTAGPATTPITLDELKGYLRIPLTQVSEDALLTLIIELVTLTAEKMTRRDLITKTYETFRSQISFSSLSILLRRSKLQVVNSIDYINKDNVSTNIPNTVWGNTSETDFSSIFLLPDQSWPTDVQCIPQSITISFDAGYGPAPEDVPADLRGALLQHAANFYENRGDCSCDGAGAELALPPQSKTTYDLYKIKSIVVRDNFF